MKTNNDGLHSSTSSRGVVCMGNAATRHRSTDSDVIDLTECSDNDNTGYDRDDEDSQTF
jgi:hypothetical protein